MTLIKEHIRRMQAYRPPLEGRDPQVHLLLDFNERTVPVSQHIKDALARFLDEDNLMVYPHYGDFCTKIASYAQVKSSQTMFTNGSDQGIDLVIRATCVAGDEIIIPAPSFAMYWQAAQVQGLSIVEVPYTDDFRFPETGLMAKISEKTKVVVIANPNSPTGTLVSQETIVAIARVNPGIVLLVDECYFEYTGVTAKDWIEELPNLFVLRTFSKTWGLSSLRIGYVLASEENISQLLKIRGPYDVNQLAVVAVQAALEQPNYALEYVREVLEVSKPLLPPFKNGLSGGF